MLIVGENLQQLLSQTALCPPESYDVNSVTLTLMNVVTEPRQDSTQVTYEHQDYEDLYVTRTLAPEGLILPPGTSVLGCSHETVVMPMGYFGQVQTKGSLARLFVSTHLNDAQVDPGFKGKITFEITNHGPFEVRIPARSSVAQLYVWKCSTDNSTPYAGRYQSASGPTVPRLR